MTADEFTLLVEGFRAAVGLNMTPAAVAAAAATAATAPAEGTKTGMKGKKAAPAFGV